MRTIRYTNRFKRDYKREKSARHGKALDGDLAEVLKQLSADTPCRGAISIILCPASGKIIATVTSGRIWSIYRKPDHAHLDLVRLGSHSELGL